MSLFLRTKPAALSAAAARIVGRARGRRFVSADFKAQQQRR